jgi:hypothetical protein
MQPPPDVALTLSQLVLLAVLLLYATALVALAQL